MIFITPGNAYRRVQVHSASQIARIDRTELGDAAQAGEVQRGGILNNQYALLVEASLGGLKTKTRGLRCSGTENRVKRSI